MFKLFVDESGNDPGQSHFVLGGYLASVPQWDAFTEAWDGLLESWGIDCFHMTCAEGRHVDKNHGYDYSAWSEKQRDARVGALARIVRRYAMAGFACDVGNAVYAESVAHAIKGNPWGYVRALKSPYPATMLFLLALVSEECERRRIEKSDVLIVLADRGGLKSREKDSIDRACGWLGFKEPLKPYPSACDWSPLQAADMLSWRTYQNCQPRPNGTRLVIPTRHRPLMKNTLPWRVTKADLDGVRITVRAEEVLPGDKLPKGRAIRVYPKDGRIEYL